jgi:hypothetical protein
MNCLQSLNDHQKIFNGSYKLLRYWHWWNYSPPLR